MRTIEISNRVYGALWSRATERDSTEEDILARLLGIDLQSTVSSPPRILTAPGSTQENGFFDARYNVRFSEGAVISRNYKGERHVARARNGKWYLDSNPKGFDSLNALNIAVVGEVSENAWMSWFFIKDGKRLPISGLRDPSRIIKRLIQKK